MLKILAVEDEGPILSSIVDMLELDNYEVITATNGIEGLLSLEEALPDLIISDVMMPKMDGHEFFRVVKEDSKTASIPFMFLTALSTYDDIRDGMNLGADDYIVKPFDYATLSTAVRTRLVKHQETALRQQQQFARRLINFQEQERGHISQQINTLIYEPIHALNLLLNVTGDVTHTRENIETISNTLKNNLQSLDEWLQPAMVTQLGLYPTLFWLIDQYRNQHNLNIDVQRAGHPPAFDHDDKIVIYRILDEIMTNIVKHASASKVFVRFHAQDGELTIDVEDNGVGYNLEAALQKDTLGLRLIDERVTLLNGELSIHTIPQSGTTLNIVLPYHDYDNHLDSVKISQGQSTHRQHESITVYLIDQQDIIRQGLTQIISHDATIKIIGESDTPTGAVSQIVNLAPDIIILDMSPADHSSFDFMQLIRDRLPQVRILCFGTYEQAVYVVESLRQGGDGYMLKSSPATEILKGLHAVVQDKQYICDALADDVMNWTLNNRNRQVTSAYEMLTERERTILLHVLDGNTSAEIGEKLSISPRTVEKHRSNFMKKLNLKTPAQLLRFAIDNGIAKP